MARPEEKPKRVVTEEYLSGPAGLAHREDGPAIIVTHEDGSVIEKYARDGGWHREDGPAIVVRSAGGAIMSEEYWLAGTRVLPSAAWGPASKRRRKRQSF